MRRCARCLGWAASIAVLLAVAGCGRTAVGEREPPSGSAGPCGVVETEFFTVHHCGLPEPAPDVLVALDEHFRVVGLGAMSVPPPVERFDLYLYYGTGEIDALCGEWVGSCAVEADVHTWRPIDRDDLVRAYLWARCGHRTIGLLEQGLADALARPAHGPVYGDAQDLWDALDPELDIGDELRAAGFVAWLASEYDLETVLQAACSLYPGDLPARVDEVFTERFGAGIDGLGAAAAASWPARATAPCPWNDRPARALALNATERIDVPPGTLLPQTVVMPAAARYARVRADVRRMSYCADYPDCPPGSGDPYSNVDGGLYPCGDPYAAAVTAVTGFGEAWAPVEPAAAGAYMVDTPRVPPRDSIGAGSFEVEVVDWAPLGDDCDPGALTPIGFEGSLALSVDIAAHAVDYAGLDPGGEAVSDSAGQVLVADGLRLWRWSYLDGAAAWLCPAGCADLPAAVAGGTCLEVPPLSDSPEGLCVAPGEHVLVILWHPRILPCRDPNCALTERRPIYFDVALDPTCG